MTAAVIAAAGSGSRTGLCYNKIFYRIDGVPMIKKTVDAFLSHPLIDKVVVVHSKEDKDALFSLFGNNVLYAFGGMTRGESVRNGLLALDDSIDKVLIHDGARPFVDEKTVTDVINAVECGTGAVAGVKVIDTVKQTNENGLVVSTPDRDFLWAAQTPQGFMLNEIKSAYEKARDMTFTDDAAVFEYFGGKVKMTEGSYNNKKLTTKEDVKMAEEFYTGIGYDVHQLKENRRLVLGGVEIPYPLGLLGHSDADVLLHSVCDALLGGAGLGDIGKHFPDTDDKYKGISSLLLLKYVKELVIAKGFKIVNVSAIVVAQKPKLKDYISRMNENIANALEIDIGRVNVAATTTETLGFEGRCEGISSQASVMLKK